MQSIHAIRAFEDNYIWLINNGKGQAIIVDPGQAKPVIAYLHQHQLTLRAILITHHHFDHAGGIGVLTKHKDIAVYGPGLSAIDGVTHPVKEGDTIHVPGFSSAYRVMAIPGHTLDHLAYVTDEQVFCGDTLFSAGCGRVFEGTPAMMHQSLSSLASLPAHTKVYCGHEYTVANLTFAQFIDPDNAALDQAMTQARTKRAKHQPTLPSTMAHECAVNPFLRVNDTHIIQRLQAQHKLIDTDPVSVFACLRQLKDRF